MPYADAQSSQYYQQQYKNPNMLFIISPAKTFAKANELTVQATTTPIFSEQITEIAQAMLRLNKEYLRQELKLNPTQTEKAYQQWRQFVDSSSPIAPTLRLYSGMVYKKIDAATLSAEDWAWLQDHLVICSFAYGMLRPMDGIRPYRLEGTLDPNWVASPNIFLYWRDVLTDYLIERVQAAGSVLCYLASEEMKQLFHWSKVEAAVRVVSPRFLVEGTRGKLKQIVVYTKMARGSMIRAAVEGRLTSPESLKELSPEGYIYSEVHSEPDIPTYILSESSIKG